MSENLKRKRGAQDFVPIEGKSSNVKPTRICATGKDAKAAIESGSKDGTMRHALFDIDVVLTRLYFQLLCPWRNRSESPTRSKRLSV